MSVAVGLVIGCFVASVVTLPLWTAYVVTRAGRGGDPGDNGRDG